MARKSSKRRAARGQNRQPLPDADIDVYSGRTLIGRIARRRREFRAIDAGGRRLGSFKKQCDAYSAVKQASSGIAVP
jgi:hypothetical protein